MENNEYDLRFYPLLAHGALGQKKQARSVSAGVKTGIRVETPFLTVVACYGRGL